MATPPDDIDPRFKQRRAEVADAEVRRRRRMMIAATSVVLIVAAGGLAVRSPLLAVRHVRVWGSVHTPLATVESAAGLSGHPNMLTVSPAKSAARVRTLPWVEAVRVAREWPATVTIRITERSPIALVRGGAGVLMVDRSGAVIAPASLRTSLPLVSSADTGTPSPGPPGTFVAAAYRPGLEVAAALPPTMLARTLGVVVGADGSVRLRLLAGATAELGPIGGSTDLMQKLQAVETVIDKANVGHKTIDVTVPSAPVLTDAAQVGTFSTATGG